MATTGGFAGLREALFPEVMISRNGIARRSREQWE
jgi:hypothetical protein